MDEKYSPAVKTNPQPYWYLCNYPALFILIPDHHEQTMSGLLLKEKTINQNG